LLLLLLLVLLLWGYERQEHCRLQQHLPLQQQQRQHPLLLHRWLGSQHPAVRRCRCCLL
jgi:hypothetical protein